MRRKFRLLFLLMIFLLLSTPAAAAISVDLLHATDGYRPGESYPVLIRIRIPDGISIHGPGDGEGFIPTTLSFPPDAAIRVTDIRFPKPEMKALPYADGPVPLFSGEILVSAKVTVEKIAPREKHFSRARFPIRPAPTASASPRKKQPLRQHFISSPPKRPSGG